MHNQHCGVQFLYLQINIVIFTWQMISGTGVKVTRNWININTYIIKDILSHVKIPGYLTLSLGVYGSLGDKTRSFLMVP